MFCFFSLLFFFPGFFSLSMINELKIGHSILKEKSKDFKYAKWPPKWLTNESQVWDLMTKNKKKMKKKKIWKIKKNVYVGF